MSDRDLRKEVRDLNKQLKEWKRATEIWKNATFTHIEQKNKLFRELEDTKEINEAICKDYWRINDKNINLIANTDNLINMKDTALFVLLVIVWVLMVYIVYISNFS